MKHLAVFGLSMIALMFFYWALVLFDASIPRAQAAQALGFKLVGTAVMDNPGESFAIIENQSTGNQGAYREGERLGEVVIKKILSGSVVIGTRTGDETLYMSSGRAITGRPPSSGDVAHLDRKEVDATVPDYEQLMQAVRVRPRFEGGEPAGFVIYKIEPGSIFARMGLKDGDVITAVNGKSIATTQQTREFYDALKEGGTVALDIRRRESRMELHFEIQ